MGYGALHGPGTDDLKTVICARAIYPLRRRLSGCPVRDAQGGLIVLLGLTLSQEISAQNGQALAQEQACHACHDPSGELESPEVPRIAGQKRNYLVKQLRDFRLEEAAAPGPYRIRERGHRAMGAQTQSLTDAQIFEIAECYASLPCLPVVPNQPTSISASSAIVRCGFCHGETGTNPYVDYPNLAGQKKSYLIREIEAFRISALTNAGNTKSDRYHRIMSPSVWDLTDFEIEKIADFFSR